jgi:hypothetical protein
MRKKLLLCMSEISLAERALARMTQMVFNKTDHKELSNKELEEITNHYLQLGFLEHTLHKVRMDLTDWLKGKDVGK